MAANARIDKGMETFFSFIFPWPSQLTLALGLSVLYQMIYSFIYLFALIKDFFTKGIRWHCY